MVCVGKAVPCDPTMTDLEECFANAKLEKKEYVGIMLQVPNEETEIIIIPDTNFDNKLAYYKHTYDENLQHKKVAEICIIGFCAADSFHEIETLLLGELEEG